MNRREWIRSILIIGALLLIVALVAQSRRECEIPGSSLVPCFFNPTKIHEQKGALRMPRHFPSPWTVEEIPGGYKVKDANGLREPFTTLPPANREHTYGSDLSDHRDQC